MKRGTATLAKDGSAWRVRVSPHVAIRIKALFPRAMKHEAGAIVLAATDQVSRDLEWFAERYPIDFIDVDGGNARRTLEKSARAFDAKLELAQRIAEGDYKPPAVEMALPPREYQSQAAHLCHSLGGLLVADSVGLGKTVTALALAAKDGALPAAIVCDTHLQSQWEREVNRFLPNLRVHRAAKGVPPERMKDSPERILEGLELPSRLPDVFLLNYHKLWGWTDLLAAVCRTVIFDEIQALRRQGSLKYQGAQNLAEACAFRMGLSATPIYNYGSEFWSVLNILSPGTLGTESEFLREWCAGVSTYGDSTKATIQDPRAFGSYVREAGLMLRRTREDVGRELPDLSKVMVPIDVDMKAIDELAGDAVGLALTICSDAKPFERMKAGGEFDMRMRQATGIAKARGVADFVRMLVEEGQAVILFGWHRAVYEIWERRLRDFEPAFYTGTESPKRKDESVRRFVEGETKVLIMSLRSGAGVDGLQHVSSTVVFGELDWSPGVIEQDIGRPHRDGQEKPVFAYFPFTDEGSDPPMLDVLDIKRGQIDGVRAPDRDTVAKEVDPHHVKKMAEAFLSKKGIKPGQGRNDADRN